MVFLLVVAFIAGYLQGAIRQLLGIASIVFSVVLAAQIRGPLGEFLIGNWTQFRPEYSRMLAFGLVFVLASFAFTIVIESVYERGPILSRFPYADPLLGGIFGVIQGGVTIGAVILILDSYFRGAGTTVRPAELLFIRDFNHAMDVSQTARIFRHDLIPAFFFFLGGLIPGEIRALFPA